jgi:hypothetical protein
MKLRFVDCETLTIELERFDIDSVRFEHQILVEVFILNVQYMPKTVRAQTPLILDHVNDCFLKFHQQYPGRFASTKPVKLSPINFYNWNRRNLAWNYFSDMFY